MKNSIIKISLLTFVLVFTSVVAAYAGAGGPPQTPIDGGLSLLLAAGGAYGLKKLKERKGKS